MQPPREYTSRSLLFPFKFQSFCCKQGTIPWWPGGIFETFKIFQKKRLLLMFFRDVEETAVLKEAVCFNGPHLNKTWGASVLHAPPSSFFFLPRQPLIQFCQKASAIILNICHVVSLCVLCVAFRSRPCPFCSSVATAGQASATLIKPA